MKQGPVGNRLDVLSAADVERIHDASLTLLGQQGIRSESDLILGIFRRAGVQVDEGTRVIRVSRELLETALRSAPRSFVLYGREPGLDMRLEPGRVYFGLGGSPEPFFWDYELRGPRTPARADMVACTRLGQALPHIDFVMALCSAGDVPPGAQYYYEYDLLLRNTQKPLIYSAPGRQHVARLLEMVAAASGGEEALRKRPSVAIFTQPVSPLQIGSYSEGMVEAAAMGVPILSSPGPMMGATSPATLAGTLAQVNAEALFGVVLAQLIKPGTPVIYAPHTGVMDMATAQCTYGSPEQSLARAAVAQLGRTYGLPTFGLGGGVEAKLPDAEAAAQAMMGMLLNGLSGLTLTQTLGTLASGLYGSAEMLVICDEIAHMVKRVLGGITVDDDTLALDAIAEVGHGGHFLDKEHTLRFFRQELFFPALFRRQTVEQWQKSGGRSILEVAHQRVLDILAHAGPVELPAGADGALTQALAGAIRDA
jgi:trimethylamine---corrinoid protein Co-methyltransferase